MNVLGIRKKANDTFFKYYRLLVPAFYLVNCVNLIAQISSSGIVTFVFEILLVTLAHGYIHMSLMICHEDVKEFKLSDMFIGVKYFGRYFPAYIVRKVIVVLAMLICMIPAFGILRHLAGSDFYKVMDQFIYLLFSNTLRMDFIQYFLTQYFSWGIIFFVVLGIVVYLYLSALFIFVPCIVEDYDYAWNEALVKSIQMMHGHVLDYIRLLCTFIPNYISYVLISTLVMAVCAFLPFMGTSVYLVLSMFLMITSFQVRFYQVVALFYLEVRELQRVNNPHELFKI